MWDEQGMWRPIRYDRPDDIMLKSDYKTQKEKVQFIDDLFNAILQKSASRANYSDLRSELVDHYIEELGEDFERTMGAQFVDCVYDYHDRFGGPRRIIKIADHFYKTKHELINRQFWTWFRQYWGAHLLFIPIGYLIGSSIDLRTQIIFMLIAVLGVVVNEGDRYYRDRQLRSSTKGGESSISFFYQYKLQIILLLIFPFNFLSVFELIDAKWLCAYVFPFMYYLCGWGYYYHLKVCQRRVAPLLEEYRSQVIAQTKNA